MRAKIRNRFDDRYSMTVHLPAEPMKLYDMLDKLGVDNQYCNVYINIDDERIPKVMQDGGFYDDIFKLNLLAQRLEQLPPADTAGFTAVLYDNVDYNLDDLILVTYGIDVYPIYPCKDYAELGEVVIDNNMIAEVENCPDELVEYLDRTAIGRLAAEQFKGRFVGGYYCEVVDYTLPDMEITIGKPERNSFQLFIGADEKSAQWFTLPYNGSLSGKYIYGIRSPLPDIKDTDDIYMLNELAEKVSALGHDDLVKLKAVMELGEIEEIDRTIEVIDYLSEFDFDPNPADESVYGKIFLHNVLPQGFDTDIFAAANMSDFGSRILNAKGGMMTSYGAISGQGQELYATVFKEQEQLEDKEAEVSLT